MSLFAFSERRKSSSGQGRTPQTESESDEGSTPQQEQKGSDELLERLKEDAHGYGWEFDETREVFRPVPAI